MELRILEAAQGQPMDCDGVRAQTVMSSTHQHPDGTVTAMRRRAAELARLRVVLSGNARTPRVADRGPGRAEAG